MDAEATTPAVDQRRRWPWIVGGVVVVLTTFVILFNWNWLKHPLERRVTAATGRSFVIGGDLDVDLGRYPRIRARDVHLGNAPWSEHKEMLALGDVDLRIALWPLFRGRIELPYVKLDRPDLLLERNEKGQGNWIFAHSSSKDDAGPGPRIHQLLVENGELRVHEPVLKTDLLLRVRTAKPDEKDARAPLVISGEGTYRGQPFELEGRLDSPLDLADATQPYDVDVRAQAGDTRAHASGALPAPLAFDAFTVNLEMSGANLGDLYTLLGVAVPETPPYSLKGRLTRDASVWSFRKFAGKVGDSDLAGDVSIDLGRDRPFLKGELVSERLDFDDLGSVIGAPPGTSATDTASKAQREQSAAARASTRVLPNSPFKLDKLRSMDADVKLEVKRIDAPKLPLERMTTHMKLDDGVLSLAPLNFHAAGGTIESRISLDAREASITTTATAEVHHLELPKLFPSVELTKSGAGVVSGAVALTAQGNSIAYMAGSANGDIGLVMGPGHISNLLVELAGLDIAESVKYLFDRNKQVPLRCAYADFKVVDGVMSARSIAFDTTDTLIFAQGDIDLRNEALAMKLVPLPKDKSPLAIRVPLKIGGTFKDPSFRPEAGPLLARGGAAAALYALAPPAALLALLETGPGKGDDLDCGPAEKQPDRLSEAKSEKKETLKR
jgi:uncharacterized protein involved in outer membrane biogenesis